VFGTQYKQHNFFVTFYNASGQETPASLSKKRAAIGKWKAKVTLAYTNVYCSCSMAVFSVD
jgi:hypothetical protein